MKKKYCLMLLCIICGIAKNFAQTTNTLYEFSYQFTPENKTYNALLIRNKNASGYIRINYLDNFNKLVVREFELDEHFDSTSGNNSYGSYFGKAIDSSKLCFVGRNPKTIIGDSTALLNKMVFQFKKTFIDDTTQIFEPLQIISTDVKTKQLFYAVPTKAKLITATDLTPNFISKYYKSNELFQPNSSANNQLANADTLYFICVANTNALNIGKSCNTDKTAMKTIFAAIARTLKLPFKSIEIFGDNFTADNVHDAIDKVKPNKNDIVVFYYSGHGFADRNPNLKFPRLDLRAGDFDALDEGLEFQIKDIYNQLVAKNVRFTLVLSDCCNAVPGAQIPVSKNAPTTRSSPLPFSEQICKNLFLNQNKFSILMTAANKGELAAGFESDGGIFTFNFREALVNLMSPIAKVTDVTWDKILNDTQINTTKKAPNAICLESKSVDKKCDQHPIKEFLKL